MGSNHLSQLAAVVLTATAVTQIAAFATSIYLHRTLSHRSLEMRPSLEIIFRILVWLSTGQVRRQWVAVHRKHHAFADRAGDPHSPQLLGFWQVQLFNVYYYRLESQRREVQDRFAPDVREDRLERYLFSHGLLGVCVGATVICFLMGPALGAAAMLLHILLYVFVIAPLINGLGHWSGQQTFANTAYNRAVLAVLTAGESLHNNHHAYPGMARFSVKRLEWDPAWVVIRVLAASGGLRVRCSSPSGSVNPRLASADHGAQSEVR